MISQKDELKSRVEAKLAELQGRLKAAQADAQSDSRGSVEQIEKQLASLQENLKNGWDNLTEAGARKLNELLD